MSFLFIFYFFHLNSRKLKTFFIIILTKNNQGRGGKMKLNEDDDDLDKQNDDDDCFEGYYIDSHKNEPRCLFDCLTSSSSSNNRNNNPSSSRPRCVCFGIGCCLNNNNNNTTSTNRSTKSTGGCLKSKRDSFGENMSEDEDMMSPMTSENKQRHSQRPNTLKLILNLICCCFFPKSSSCHQHNDLQNNSDQYSDIVDMESNNNNKKLQLKLKPNGNVGNNKDGEEFIERPPVTCIRVLRPSNDLTPVRFDSHYNIIQAVSSGSLSGPSGNGPTAICDSPTSNKSVVDVISSIMEDAIKPEQQQFTTTTTTIDENEDNNFGGGGGDYCKTYTKV